MKLNRYLAASLGLAVGLLGTPTSAEAVIASVKSIGMAACAVAYPQDALVAAYNPAGNAEIGDRVDSGIWWAHDEGHLKIHGNILNQNPIINELLDGAQINGNFQGMVTKDNYAGDFGINKTFGCDCEWSIGFVAYNRNFQKTKYNQPLALVGTSNPGLEYLQNTNSLVLAYKINEMFDVGLNVNFLVQRIKFNGLQKIDQAAPSLKGNIISAHPGHVTNKGYDWSTGWGAQIGFLWHVTCDIMVGATYQPETQMTRFDKYKGTIAGKGKFNVPQQWSAGISWRFMECATACFDYQYYDWEQIPALANPLLHKGVIEPLGSTNGPGFGWRSQSFYRFGVDYAVTDDIVIRAGYRYGNTPVRNTQTVFNALTLDLVEQFVTCGATYTFNESYEVSACFAYGFEHKVNGKHSIPEGLPAPLSPENGLGGGNADLREWKTALGLSLGWNY